MNGLQKAMQGKSIYQVAMQARIPATALLAAVSGQLPLVPIYRNRAALALGLTLAEMMTEVREEPVTPTETPKKAVPEPAKKPETAPKPPAPKVRKPEKPAQASALAKLKGKVAHKR